MEESRTLNTKRNIIWSLAEYLTTVIFQFVSRFIIVQVLGAEYLGLSSLFTSILHVLNMAELGFSTAIIYNMYKPIANNDIDTVCSLLAYYRKIYRIIGTILLTAGFAVMPFLPYLISGEYPSDINIYILYSLYVANTGISYFLFAYKTSLLNALQRLDLTKIAYCIVNVSQYVLQIVVLIAFKGIGPINYYLFVAIMIVGTASKNLLAALIVSKRYPQYKCYGKLDVETKKNVIEKVKGLLICNISGVTYTTFDSIIISAFIGLSTVAIYNNYLTVYSGVASIVVLIRSAMQASVGNSVAKESIEKNLNDIKKWQFLFSIIATICSSCMLCMFQPFMILWMGEDMLLPTIDVFLISAWLFVSTIQHAFYLYLSATGLWWDIKWAYILSTIVNLALNLILCNFIGTTGIIAATLISSLIFGTIWQCAIIFKKYFGMNATKYFATQLIYIVFAGVVWVSCYFLCSLISCNLFLSLFLRLLICCFLTTILTILVFFKTNVFKQCMNLFLVAIKSKNKKV